MGLRDITISRTTISYRENDISVRGVSVADIMFAARDYGPQIALAWGKWQAGDVDTTDVRKTILGMAGEVPDLIAATIALASDDYSKETVEIARQLPVNTQAELIEAIFNETFYSEADVKKLTESLTRMIGAVSGALTTTTASLSAAGIGGFDEKLTS